jgi:hypothetical protein
VKSEGVEHKKEREEVRNGNKEQKKRFKCKKRMKI